MQTTTMSIRARLRLPGAAPTATPTHDHPNGIKPRNPFRRILTSIVPQLAVLAFAALLLAPSANAAAIASVQAGDWSDPATWGGTVPAAGDDVTLTSGFNVAVTADAACVSVTFDGATGTTTTLSISTGVTLSASGTLTITRPTTSGTNTVAVGDGILNAGSIAFTSGGTSQRHFLTINTGTVSVAGDVYTVANTTTSAVITFTGAGYLTVASQFFPLAGTVVGTGATANGGGTFNKGTGTVEYNGSAAQTVKAFAYHNLILYGSDAKSMGNGISVTGNLTIAPTGSAYASVANGANLSVNILTLGSAGQFKGSWGSSGSTATNPNETPTSTRRRAAC